MDGRAKNRLLAKAQQLNEAAAWTRVMAKEARKSARTARRHARVVRQLSKDGVDAALAVRLDDEAEALEQQAARWEREAPYLIQAAKLLQHVK